MLDLWPRYVLHINFPWSAMDLLAEDEVRIDEGANFHEGQTSSMRTSWREQSSAKSIRAGSGEGLSQAAEVVDEMEEFLGYRSSGLANPTVRPQCTCSCMPCHSSLLGPQVTAHTLSVSGVKSATCKWGKRETSSPSFCIWSGQSVCQPLLWRTARANLVAGP